MINNAQYTGLTQVNYSISWCCMMHLRSAALWCPKNSMVHKENNLIHTKCCKLTLWCCCTSITTTTTKPTLFPVLQSLHGQQDKTADRICRIWGIEHVFFL